ncbi:serpin B [Fodinibius roseus]|uniref:Serpin B n=1 Tax=Fodinibius roseus TaxID=1194090 RepID=A0A1M5ESY3_9BACT|nr:serpin family protein [Fodinibius roseus]SHF82221.1 serpin B [Fodinibius roseus]
MVKYLLSTALIIGFLLAGCDSLGTQQEEQSEFERRELPRQLTEQETELVNGSGHFGFNLLGRLVEKVPGESHFISPLSIQMAYGMVMNGAESDTYNQMRNTLGMDGMNREQINESAKELIELLTQFDESVQFNIANSIWYRDTFSVEQDFLNPNKTYYEAAIEEADFADPKTVERINGWVSDKTGGLIEKITDNIDPNEIMYLLNAIYFNGDWTIPFDPDNTETKPFHLPNGSTADAEMMQLDQQEQMSYRRGEDYQAVNLYYGDAGFMMTLVLPDEDKTLGNWVTNMTWDDWRKLTGNFSKVTLTLEMPKFELEYEVEEFEKVLMAMGIEDAFGPEADFSRITGGPNGLYIGESRHKTFISVDEKGTEAAAVTSAVVVESAPQTVEVSFNRPFFYVIREVESETILFMGTMTDPTQ